MIEIKYLNKQWYVKTDPNQLPEEELVFDSFEQVSRFVEGDQLAKLLLEADDSCPRPEEYYAGVGESPKVSCEEIARENDLAARDFAIHMCQSKHTHLLSCDKDGYCNFCGEQ